MKKVFAILVILLLLLAGYIWYSFKGGKKRDKGPKPVALAVGKHSPAFNQSIRAVLEAYYNMSEGFVNWDTSVVNREGSLLKSALDSLKIDELKKDTLIYLTVLDPLANAKTEVATIISNPSLDNKRKSLNILSDDLIQLIRTVKYDRSKLYWQECPMAFGDDQPGYWLSKTDAVRNPYLGTSHPKYKDGMLKCGGPKDTINFMVQDTTGNK